jgi:hypothetical protein
MCARADAAQEVKRAAECLSKACLDRAPPSYRANLEETLREGIPEWAKELLRKLD